MEKLNIRQESFLSDQLVFPMTYEDLQSLYDTYIFEGERDDDAFTWRKKKEKEGRSYFMYGKKVFEFIPGDKKSARLILSSENKKIKPKRIKPNAPPSVLMDVVEQLKQTKRSIFRSLVIEEFACCNDFLQCSDRKQCLYPRDRFYNGCYYRKNLEAGRIFYGKNRNVE